jgi:hypothetical protein
MTLRRVGKDEYVEGYGGDYEDFETGIVIRHWSRPTTPGRRFW